MPLRVGADECPQWAGDEQPQDQDVAKEVFFHGWGEDLAEDVGEHNQENPCNTRKEKKERKSPVEPCRGAQIKGQQGTTKRAGRCDLPFERFVEDSPSEGG